MATKQNSSGLRWIIITAAIVVVAAAGIWYFKRGGSDAPQYQTTPVTRGELTKLVTATGTLNPVVNVTVGSQVSGRISKLNVDFNSIVKSNEVIAEIDPSTYQAAVEQSTADLANAKANLELQQVEANRSSELFTNKLISGSDFDTAIATLHEAEAMVKIKTASLNNAMVNLNYCKIVAPVDGVVISRAVELGQTVASSFNTPTIFQIANDLTKMQIDSSGRGGRRRRRRGAGCVFHRGCVSRPDVSWHSHSGAQFADDGQQRRHLRLRHRGDEFGLQAETRHDGER
jgi:HlyD family secretion protein